MILRILPLLLCAGMAACDSGGAGGSGRGASAGGVRLDTVAGFTLGMLLPEARQAAAARGHTLLCQPATTAYSRESVGDSIWQKMQDVDYCEPPDERMELSFKQGTLIAVSVRYSEDWARVPLDTVVSRLSDGAGPPSRREVQPFGDGRPHVLVTWSRDDDPAVMQLRCPQGGSSRDCTRDHYLSR